MPSVALLTGFEPFGGAERNPSADAVAEVARGWDRSEPLVTAVLPVAFDAARRRLEALLIEHRPAVVLGVGLAGGRTSVAIERVAVNLADARIPDNVGAQPIDEPCVTDAPTAYLATVPVKAMLAAAMAAGVPAVVSHSAGTFVCNHVMYTALHRTAGTPVRAGFVHVPWSAETAPAASASLPLADIARGVDAALRCALDRREDLAVVGGAIA